MNNKEDSRSFSLKDESLLEMKRLEESVNETIERLEEYLNRFPSPFILIPTVVHPLTFGNSVKTHIFKKRNAYLTFLWESMETLRVSVALCFGFRYSGALSLLRTSLETLIRAAFYDSVSQKKYRMEDPIAGLKARHFITGILSDILRKDPDLEKKMEESSSELLEALQTLMIDETAWWQLPGFTNMIEALESWSLLDPLKGEEVIDLYGWLSKPVHMVPQFTDVVIQITSLNNAFGDLKFVKDITKEYMYLLSNVLDVGLVLTFNILQHEHDGDYISDVARELESDDSITEERLPSFKLLLDKYAG